MDIGNTETTDNKSVTKSVPAKDNKKLLLIILGVLVVVFMITQIASRISEQNNNVDDKINKDELINNTMQEAQQKLGDDFYNQASDGAPVPKTNTAAPVNEANPAAQAEPEPNSPHAKAKAANDELVTVNITNVGRANPFVPAVNVPGVYGSALGLPTQPPPSAYPAPPTQLITDDSAVKLMQTTISGIMYDAFSPSAIVNVEGQDHLVRKGDRINGYKILNITKDRVVVQNGTNVYRATVGETLSTTQNGQEVYFNNVYNLQNKFGGANAPANTRMIQIN